MIAFQLKVSNSLHQNCRTPSSISRRHCPELDVNDNKMALPNQVSTREVMKDKNGMSLFAWEARSSSLKPSSVAGGELAPLSKGIPTSFFRDRYCRTGPEEMDDFSVWATVNQELLYFTDSKCNNPREAGVKRWKWCLGA